jgi:hypothetical protein
MFSGLNASPASRSIGTPEARASLSAVNQPFDPPFLNPGIEPPSSLLRWLTRSGG